ncbi:uncharacterized protein [Littorina saxatilis]|uniref:uncharacterized protein n=1 Tax=Littorina saxatilis TaxID=31220 RepID=UPI0038B65666
MRSQFVLTAASPDPAQNNVYISEWSVQKTPLVDILCKDEFEMITECLCTSTGPQVYYTGTGFSSTGPTTYYLIVTCSGGDPADPTKVVTVTPAVIVNVRKNIAPTFVKYPADKAESVDALDSSVGYVVYEASATDPDSGNAVSYYQNGVNNYYNNGVYYPNGVKYYPNGVYYNTDDQAVTYGITSQDPNDGFFEINEATGEVKVAKSLKSATRSSYTLTLSACDVSDCGKEMTVTVPITNLNTAPVFEKDLPATIDLNEEQQGGQTIVILRATDTDQTVSVVCSVAPSSEAYKFVYYDATGEIKLASTTAGNTLLDYEGLYNTYTITCVASDGYLTTEGVLTVNVKNVWEAPVFPQTMYYCNLEESAAEESQCTLGLSATDPDLNYYYNQPSNGVNSNNIINNNNNYYNNYYQNNQNGYYNNQGYYTSNCNNNNNNNNNNNYNFNPNNPYGLTFSLVSSTYSDNFKYNDETDQLTFAVDYDVDNDMDAKPQIVKLTIKATDPQGCTATSQITVTVADVNDNTCQVTNIGAQALTVNQGTALGGCDLFQCLL